MAAAAEQVSLVLQSMRILDAEQDRSPHGHDHHSGGRPRTPRTGTGEDGHEDVLPEGGARCVLEDFTRVSESHLWKLMMSFYERKGPESWAQGIVPHFITSNAFIGRAYAKVLHGYLQDSLASGALDPSQPLYIVELGAGSGKFSFYMLRALDELQELCAFPMNKIVYVMTDFTRSNFDFWSTHPSLKPYFDRGVLDAAIFDAVADSSITLWRSGTVLRRGGCGNPVAVVANYLFDTLCHDSFQVKDGELCEGLVQVGSSRLEEPDPLDPDIIQRLDNRYMYRPVSDAYYQNEEGDETHLERMLAWYRERFRRTAWYSSRMSCPLSDLA